MKAREIALSAYEQAVAAEEARVASVRAAEVEERRKNEERHRKRFERALVPLNLWFPGVKWSYEIAGDFNNDTVVYDLSENQWPPSFKLLVKEVHNPRDNADVTYIEFEVGDYVVDHHSGGYSYFSGSKVESAADLGRYLKAKEGKNDSSR